MNIQALQESLRAFYVEREWDQFHSPKNLVMAMSAEMGELSEIFQWLDLEQAQRIMQDDLKAHKVREEMADVFVYLISLADKLGVDLIQAAAVKIERNRAKYPVEKSKGNSKKYNEL